MASSLVQDERIQTLNDVEQRDGEYVLEYAVQRANDLGQRLPVVFGLTDLGPITYNHPRAT